MSAANGQTQGELESLALAAVFRHGTKAMVGLPEQARDLLHGEWRMAYDAAVELARRGEVGPGGVTPELAEAEIARFGGDGVAVRQVIDAALGHAGTAANRPDAAGRAFEALADFGTEAGERKPAAPVLPPVLLAGGRLLDTQYPPVSFAAEPYFPRAEVTELVGAHGIFKSTVALGACCAVATGRRWGGAPTTKGRAVFITMEDGERTVAHRVRAWLEGVPAGQEQADAEADLRGNLAFLSREHARDLGLTSTDRTSTFQRESVVKHLSALVQGSVVVVLETASRLHNGPEMNEALAVFAQAIEQIAVGTGAAVVIVRHVSKQAARDGTVDSYVGRGGGALSDAARSVLVMTWDRKAVDGGEEELEQLAPVRLTHTKATLSAKGPRIVWKPVPAVHGVYLVPFSRGEEAREDCRRLVEHLGAVGSKGVPFSELHKKPPAGLSRGAAKRAMEQLVSEGRVVSVEEERGQTRQRALVYRLAGDRP